MRQKGCIKTGGRKAGTPNKVTADLKRWVSDILADGRQQFVECMSQLEPAEYVKAYSALLNYVMPKQQALSVDAQVAAEYRQLTLLLQAAPERAVELIAAKLLELQDDAGGEPGQ